MQRNTTPPWGEGLQKRYVHGDSKVSDCLQPFIGVQPWRDQTGVYAEELWLDRLRNVFCD